MEVIKGNPEAVKAVETLTKPVQEKPVVVAEQKQPVQQETVKKSQVPEKQQEEEHFGGESTQKQASPKKVESKAPTPA